ncbi:MerR family transcriptional regulator [Afipia sp. TerB]
MDKAPDAFRTISEVADDLDIPAHVLRFWETRFAQIKPMKRSGGRRYYRPDDVDLLRGIRRLLYGEGYTIRGVQRILREHGIKAVQGLVDGSAIAPAAFAGGGSGGVKPARRVVPDSDPAEDDDVYQNGHDGTEDEDDIEAAFDDEAGDDADDAADTHDDDHDVDSGLREPVFDRPMAAKPVIAKPLPPGPSNGAEFYAPPGIRKQPAPDRGKLQAVLDDLIGARELIDQVLKDERQS